MKTLNVKRAVTLIATAAAVTAASAAQAGPLDTCKDWNANASETPYQFLHMGYIKGITDTLQHRGVHFRKLTIGQFREVMDKACQKTPDAAIKDVAMKTATGFVEFDELDKAKGGKAVLSQHPESLSPAPASEVAATLQKLGATHATNQ
ncbi:hypothetical protein [Paraburkholderia sp. GAS32]|uniref:hypothetical protein n=1 Tax=Paraburkholderia sp. GAS32 TaxID=3035129 RepID=UPI003D1B3D56